jgi:hypothetical protein
VGYQVFGQVSQAVLTVVMACVYYQSESLLIGLWKREANNS